MNQPTFAATDSYRFLSKLKGLPLLFDILFFVIVPHILKTSSYVHFYFRELYLQDNEIVSFQHGTLHSQVAVQACRNPGAGIQNFRKMQCLQTSLVIFLGNIYIFADKFKRQPNIASISVSASLGTKYCTSLAGQQVLRPARNVNCQKIDA